MDKHQKIANARGLRRNSTDAERHLWRFLRNRQLGGYRFRRQVPLGRYFADFACLYAKIIIELDGSQHAENTTADEVRTEYLERGGFRVLRFWNSDALLRTHAVLELILESLHQSAPHPDPLPQAGEGDNPRSRVPVALYIHIPWCVKKCPYCDFNSHGLRAAMPTREYVAALLADLDGELADFDGALRGREIISVFFGGGTPSLFPPDAIAAILEGASARLRFAHDCEITLETNPGTVEHGRFEDYLKAGVNRISFGIQSFDDDKLHALGRIHSSAEAEAAVKLAQDAGYANINLDLMYALPQQTLDGALRDVERAFALRPAHISHYQLTLEPGTPFAKRPPPLPEHDAAWDMQEACEQRLAEAGFMQYEVSAYAQPGRRCRHNLNYWQFGDYLGIGAGAHGKMTGLGTRGEAERLRDAGGIAREAERPRQGRRGPGCLASAGCASLATGPGLSESLAVHRRWKVRSPIAYLQNAAKHERISGEEQVDPAELPFEFMLNALRLNDGVASDTFHARTGLPVSAIAPQRAEARARGWLTDDADRIKATPLGRRFLNDLIEVFLPEPPHA